MILQEEMTVEVETDYRLLIIGCSAGGLNLLMEMIEALQPSGKLAVIVVVHRNDKFPSALEEILQQKCRLTIKQAAEKEAIAVDTVYFAPGGYHLLIERNFTLSLDVSEPVHYCRPSIDVTMEQVARVYGGKTIAMLLSGANKDGAAGMEAVAARNGLTIAQDPLEAEVDIMPLAAIARGAVKKVYSNAELISFCKRLTS